MKSIFYILVLLLNSTFCLAQTFTFNQGGTSSKNYYEEVPYETINGKMFVSVEIAGQKHKFLFDTGAPVAISKELATQAGSMAVHKDIFKDAFGNKDSSLVISLDSIQLGKLIFNHLPAITIIPNFYKCWHVDGVIGSNLLRNSIVSIDPVKHIIILTDHEEKLPLKNKKSIPLITTIGAQSDPKIMVRFKDKIDVQLGFDTGDSNFLRIPEDYMNRLKKSGVYEIISKGFGANSISVMGAEKNADKYRLKIPFLNISDSRFENVFIETSKNAIPGIGAKLLEYGIVTLDFIHNKFYFDATNSSNDLNEKQWPFQPTVTGDKLVIGVVWEKAINQVKPGQQIIAVNDVDYSKINLCDMVNNKPILAGKETATITVKDELGNIKKLQISKE